MLILSLLFANTAMIFAADDIVLYAKWYKPSTPVTPVAPDPTVVVDGPGSADDN